jgi:hypothetical protein
VSRQATQARQRSIPRLRPTSSPSAAPRCTSIATAHSRSETGWSDGGGGCSRYETANSAQSSFSGYTQVHCASGRRATPDVSLDADPASGVAVYDSVTYQGQSGWFQVGGTSASSPMWAARSAVAGVVVNAAYVYGSSITYRDITSGNNVASCLGGFDLCSGRGSWTGTTPSPSHANHKPDITACSLVFTPVAQIVSDRRFPLPMRSPKISVACDHGSQTGRRTRDLNKVEQASLLSFLKVATGSQEACRNLVLTINATKCHQMSGVINQ